MTALDRLRDHWQSQGLAWKEEAGGKASAQAPGHSPSDRSVTFRQIAGQVLMNSHADDKAAVLDAAGLTMRDLFDDATGVTYGYSDGRTVHRTYDDSGKKKFRQTGNTAGTSLYRAEKLDDHPTGIPVYVTEGEKDVDALESVGAVAVCPAMGAGKASKFDWSPLFGHTVLIVADKDAPGRKHAQQVAEILDGKASVGIVEAAVGKDAADHIAADRGLDEFAPVEVPGAGNRRQLKVTRGSQVVTRRVQWLMPDWIPTGSLTLLAGREGLGKSTIAAELCAQITRGNLDGELHGTPRNVLYVHTEDAREFTVAPRLRAAGADMDRVLFVDVQTDATESGTLILPLDTLALEAVIAEHDVAFVVLDAATSSMSSELSGKDDRAVRQYLEPLSQLAARRGCVVFGLCHFGKRDGADTGKLILGSIAWSQVARSVLSVAKDEETGNLVVTNTKGNLAPRTRSMEATIVSTTIPTDDGDADVGVLQWLGETDRDARELLSDSDGPDKDERTEAEHWLADFLTEHGRPAGKEVKAAAAKERIPERALKEAARKLRVIYTPEGFPRTTRWSLPAQWGQSEQDDLSHVPTVPTVPTGDDQRKRGVPTGADSQLGRIPVNVPTGDPTIAELYPALADPDSMVSHVTPAAGTRQPAEAPERLCPECEKPTPAGMVRHIECTLAKSRRGDAA